MRTRLVILGLSVLGAACTGWLIDYKGTKCNSDGSCGGKLVCDPATNTCQDKASVALDGGAADTGNGPQDASMPLDAAMPPDAAALIAPTIECDGGQDWCPANLPSLDGGWPDFTSVAGRSADDIWVAGNGPALLHWNGSAWTDFSTKVAHQALAAGYPVMNINTVLIAEATLVYAGEAPPGTHDPSSNDPMSSACGYKFLNEPAYPDNSFSSQDWCASSSIPNAWRAGSGGPIGYLLVGDNAQFFEDETGFASIGTIAPAGVYHAVSHAAATVPSGGTYYETWAAGAQGALCYQIENCATTQATTKGFPGDAGASMDFLAIANTVDALFLGGQGVLFECTREGDLGSPFISDCQNYLGPSPLDTIVVRSLSGTARNDMWAAGADGATQVVLQRKAANDWTKHTVPMLSGALKAVLRIPGVVVVVGEKGALLSKTVP